MKQTLTDKEVSLSLEWTHSTWEGCKMPFVNLSSESLTAQSSESVFQVSVKFNTEKEGRAQQLSQWSLRLCIIESS